VVLQIVTDVLLVIGGVSAVYSMLSSKPRHRRGTARQIAVLAVSGVLLSEAHTRSGWSHWMNLGIAVFGIGSVVLQVVWERRHTRSREKSVPESTTSILAGYKRPTGY
jgi:hypothetical protein